MFRRKPGTKPLYTPTATKRYKSRWLRWMRGRDLQPDQVLQTATGYRLRWRSTRAADGFWELDVTPTTGGGGSGGSGGSGGGGGDGQYYTVFAFSIQSGTDTSTPGIPYDPVFPICNVFNTSQVSRFFDGRVAFMPKAENGGTVLWTTTSGLYYYDGTTVQPVGGVLPPDDAWYFEAFQLVYGTAFDSGYQIVLAYRRHNGISGNPPSVGTWAGPYQQIYSTAIVECGYVPPTGGGSDPEEGANGFFVFGECNCPDSTKMQEANPRSPWHSERRLRSFANSNAGADGFCKHEVSARFYFKVPLPEPRPDDPAEQERWKRERAADRRRRREEFLRRRREGINRTLEQIGEQTGVEQLSIAEIKRRNRAEREYLKGLSRQRKSALRQQRRAGDRENQAVRSAEKALWSKYRSLDASQRRNFTDHLYEQLSEGGLSKTQSAAAGKFRKRLNTYRENYQRLRRSRKR
jgi:hypothetical protein